MILVTIQLASGADVSAFVEGQPGSVSNGTSPAVTLSGIVLAVSRVADPAPTTLVPHTHPAVESATVTVGPATPIP